MDLGQRLRSLREGHKYSLSEVGNRVGLHFSTIAKYERNERQPHIDILRDLAALYGVSPASLITEADDLHDLLPPDQLEWLTLLRGRPLLASMLADLAQLSDGQLDALANFLAVFAGPEPQGRLPAPAGPLEPAADSGSISYSQKGEEPP